MATTVVARLVLFLSSYSPLFVILGLLSSANNLMVGISFYLLAIVSAASLAVFLRAVQRYSPYEINVAKVTVRDSELTSYLVTYLLPFLVVPFNDRLLVVSVVILFIIIAIVCVQSGLIHINPLLAIWGYHLFDVETQEGKVSALICRHPYVRTGSTVEVVSMSDYVLMEKMK